ncbi:hypothetical protein LCGC14_1200740 [marine sediment metagenome]|uniref:Uncharacterized protein n=1 Tax=marine sediment metagenome TaxID=412755 RepID=A0A0F9NZD6_9ZZZZ
MVHEKEIGYQIKKIRDALNSIMIAIAYIEQSKMISVRFICSECGKAYHIDELGYSEITKRFYCTVKTCDNLHFGIKKVGL